MNEFTGQAIGLTLLERLEHPDQNRRANAAYQIGRFCNLLFCEWDCREDYAEDILDCSYVEDGTSRLLIG